MTKDYFCEKCFFLNIFKFQCKNVPLAPLKTKSKLKRKRKKGQKQVSFVPLVVSGHHGSAHGCRSATAIQGRDALMRPLL